MARTSMNFPRMNLYLKIAVVLPNVLFVHSIEIINKKNQAVVEFCIKVSHFKIPFSKNTSNTRPGIQELDPKPCNFKRFVRNSSTLYVMGEIWGRDSNLEDCIMWLGQIFSFKFQVGWWSSKLVMGSKLMFH